MASDCGPRTVLIVLVLIVVTAITTAAYLFTSGRVTTAPSLTSTPTPAPVTVPAPHPRSTPSLRVGAPRGLKEAVEAFLSAWSTVDPGERAAGLADTATGQLAEQLTLTDPDEVPPACALAGALQVADLTPTSVLVTVPTTCEGSLWLGLKRDDTAGHGWRVTAIGRERSWIQ